MGLSGKLGKAALIGLAGYSFFSGSKEEEASTPVKKTNPKKKDSPEKRALWKKWDRLVNMTSFEIREFLASSEGKKAGLSRKEAAEKGIKSGRDSARALLKMIPCGRTYQSALREWSPSQWKWAERQVAFISRMRKIKGSLTDPQGNKTRKHTSLLLWGHNPKG